MKDKEIIEEIAITISGSTEIDTIEYYNALIKAKQIYEIIFPKDSVVLSRKEYERLVKTAQGKIGNMKSTDFLKACISSGVMVEAVSTEEQVKQAYEKGCKETAEKIFKMLISKLESNQFLSGKRIIMEVDVENLAKQFDVEIE